MAIPRLTTKHTGKKNSLWQLYIGTGMTHQGWHFDLLFMKSRHVFAFITCGHKDIFACPYVFSAGRELVTIRTFKIHSGL